MKYPSRRQGAFPYGFDWGPMTVTRLMHKEQGGYVLGIETDTRRLQVYVSEKGRSVRVFEGDDELTVQRNNDA